MTRRDGSDVELHKGRSAVSRERTGWFRFYFDGQRWEWSEQVQRLHGYEPGTVTPTTELVLAHKHPDDRGQVAATIYDITHTRGVFSSRHRIIDTKGRVRWVVVIGDQFRDDDGAVIGTHGFYVDVTPVEQFREDLVSARVGEVADSRAPIEQVKGMLMLIYDIDPEVAFGLLKWLSQENNVKLRASAEQLCTDLRAAAAAGIVPKSVFDHALLTAHQRIAGESESLVTVPHVIRSAQGAPP
jgi:PAS domain S-box-containing protein